MPSPKRPLVMVKIVLLEPKANFQSQFPAFQISLCNPLHYEQTHFLIQNLLLENTNMIHEQNEVVHYFLLGYNGVSYGESEGESEQHREVQCEQDVPSDEPCFDLLV